VSLFVGQVLGDFGARACEGQLVCGSGARVQMAVPAKLLAGEEEPVLDSFSVAVGRYFSPRRRTRGSVPTLLRPHSVALWPASRGRQSFARRLQSVDGDAVQREQFGGHCETDRRGRQGCGRQPAHQLYAKNRILDGMEDGFIVKIVS
jgi:hypothetical protein